jgi:type IV pilus assembly protein PilM
MAGILQKMFGKKSTSVIGVDIGTSAIKVIQLSRKGGKAILETYGEIALGPYGGVEIGRSTNLSPEKIAEALVDLMRESKVTTAMGALSIPYGSSLITTIEMPAVAEKQLTQMIPIEARKYIPVPLAEVALDWWVIPKSNPTPGDYKDKEEKAKPDDNKVEVLLVAIHNEALNRYQTIIKKSAIEASFFEIEIFSAIRSVLDEDPGSRMIVDLGAASTKVYILEEGIVHVSHIINRGSQDITLALSKSLGITVEEAEVYKRDLSLIPPDKQKIANDVISVTLDFIFSDIGRVLLGHQKKYNRSITRAVLVGGGARLQNVTKFAEAHLQTEIVLGDPFIKAEAPSFLEEVLKHTGPEFAVAMGIALRRLQETQ